MIPYNDTRRPPEPLWMLKGRVLNIVEHEQSSVNHTTGTKHYVGRWRELTLQTGSREPAIISGDVVYGARVGDDVALVIDPKSSRPVCLVNENSQKIFLDRSADPDMPPATGMLRGTFVLAVVVALPGFLIFYMLVGGLISQLGIHTIDELFQPLASVFPFVLLPICWKISKFFDQRLRERARCLHDKIQKVLQAEGIKTGTKPIVV